MRRRRPHGRSSIFFQIGAHSSLVAPHDAAAELVGTGGLVCVVVGSGVMGERPSGGNLAIALLANTIATRAAPVALILTFASVSGSPFNPVVTLVQAIQGRRPVIDTVAVVAAQLAGGVIDVVVAHATFDLTPIRRTTTDDDIERAGRALVDGCRSLTSRT